LKPCIFPKIAYLNILFMKYSFLLLFLVAAIGADAQKDPYSKMLDRYNQAHPIPGQSTTGKFSPSFRHPVFPSLPAIPEARHDRVLENGNQVFLLPQDNMPCIVPDNKNYRPDILVNARVYRYNGPGAISNPGIVKK
jgi:hypothetical protein